MRPPVPHITGTAALPSWIKLLFSADFAFSLVRGNVFSSNFGLFGLFSALKSSSTLGYSFFLVINLHWGTSKVREVDVSGVRVMSVCWLVKIFFVDRIITSLNSNFTTSFIKSFCVCVWVFSTWEAVICRFLTFPENPSSRDLIKHYLHHAQETQ